MLEKNDAEVRVANLLLARKDDKGQAREFEPWAVEVFKLLVSKESPYEDIYRICSSRERGLDYQAIADIIVAVTAFDPPNCHKWFGELSTVFLLTTSETVYMNGDFFLGLPLGIFQAGLWLDQNWKRKTEFEERLLKNILQKIVEFAKAPALDFADEEMFLPAQQGRQKRIEYYQRVLPAYQGKLANAVKRFFRPDQLDAVGVMQFIAQKERVYDPPAPSAGSRLALAYDFMDWFVSRLPVKTTKLGEIMAGQIAYAVAGSISGIAVLEAIHWRLSQFLSPPASPKPEAFPEDESVASEEGSSHPEQTSDQPQAASAKRL